MNTTYYIVYFIGWLLFGIFCRILGYYANTRSKLGQIVEIFLSGMWLTSVTFLFLILMSIPFPK